ncbi:tetratricopeptide repeat protein [Nibrella viscosa]|uniref:Tetratricopeptide repeat protein n=1 Tax=Nibrella viscosa TaxID=1084524 RepID=A0ABP8KYJ4_9BACT
MKQVLTLLALVLLTSASFAQTTASEWFNKGYAATDYNEQIRCYTEAIRLDPTYAAAYNNRGNTKYNLGQYQPAIYDFDEAIRLDPTYAYAYNNRGLTKYNLGQYQQAINDYDEAIRLDPTYAYAYNNRGWAKHNLGQYQQAIYDYDEAIRLDPKNAYAYNNRGWAKHNLGQYQPAIYDYDEAIRLDSKFAKSYLNKGQALVALNRCQEALEFFRQGEGLDNSLNYHLQDKQKAQQCATSTVVTPSVPPSTSSAGKRYALVIGNSSYRYVSSLARQPRSDAETMARRFTELGFTVTTAYDLKSKSELETTVFDFADKARQADMVAVYYAGHGMEFGGHNYLIPTEAKLERDERAEVEALSLDYLLARLGRSQARLSLVMLDACRNNPFEGRNRDLGDGDYRAFKIVGAAPPRNVMVFYATQPGRVATNAGVFADAVRQHLQRGTRLTEFLMNVTNTVDQRTGQSQAPFQSGTLFGDFTF